jgi:hypothetical protein
MSVEKDSTDEPAALPHAEKYPLVEAKTQSSLTTIRFV